MGLSYYSGSADVLASGCAKRNGPDLQLQQARVDQNKGVSALRRVEQITCATTNKAQTHWDM